MPYLALASNENISSVVDSVDSDSRITGLSPALAVEVQGLTEFVNETVAAVTVRGSSYKTPVMVPKDGAVMDLRAYLKRPIVLTTGTFNQTVRSSVYTWFPTIPLLSNALIDFGRLAGSYGVRFTTCFRLQIAAQPFQAGVLRMTWVPQPSANDYFSAASAGFNANYASQLPGVYLDIAEDTAVEFRAPWVNSLDYLPYNGNFTCAGVSPAIGQLNVYAYLPVTLAAAAAAPTYTIWLWLEDVELIAATGEALLLVAPQSGFMSGKIPLISSYLSNVGGGISDAYGWSRKQVVESTRRVFLTSNIYQNNCDGSDTTLPLGLSVSNKILPLPGFAGSTVDEMALTYVVGQPALVANFTLKTTDIVGTLKYGASVCPGAFWYQGSYNSASYPVSTSAGVLSNFLTSPLFYVSQAFKYWRGTTRFTFRVAKTKFHAGRIIVGFNPRLCAYGPSQPTSTGKFYVPHATDVLNFKSVIWDLKESNVLVFDVPFISPLGYLENIDALGDLFVSVVDPLQAPDSVANSISFAVEVSGCPDYEFAVPTTPYFLPSPKKVGTANFPGFVAQSGFSPYSDTSPSPALFAIGERVNSIKQLISRACYVGSVYGDVGATVLSYGKSYFDNVPSVYLIPSTGKPTEASYAASSIGYAGYFRFMYAYARGSTCGTVYPKGYTNVTVGILGDVPFSSNAPSAQASGLLSDRGVSHFTVPYFSSTSRTRLGMDEGAGYSLTGGSPFIMATPLLSGNVAAIGYLNRAGPDAQLGYFLGSPPLECPNIASAKFYKAWYSEWGTLPTV